MSIDFKPILIKNSYNPNLHVIDRYLNFIEYCKNLHFNEYTETHHIVPRSFGGTNCEENLIKLGARHHYIAHLLLAKATCSPKMIKALHKMTYSKSHHVQRNYKISSRNYAYLREEHSRIVSQYSKDTVVAKHMFTDEIKRIPKKLFEKYNNVLYVSISKNRKDSPETRHKKQLASQRPRKVQQNSEIRRVAASRFSYQTPKGFCHTSKDLFSLYSSFTANTLTVIKDNAIITNKFASIHKEFAPYIGKTFAEYGIIKLKRS